MTITRVTIVFPNMHFVSVIRKARLDSAGTIAAIDPMPTGRLGGAADENTNYVA